MWHKILWLIYVRQCLIAACCVNREIKYIRGYLRKYFLKFKLNIVQLLSVLLYRIIDIMYQILKQEASCAFKFTKGHAHDAHFFCGGRTRQLFHNCQSVCVQVHDTCSLLLQELFLENNHTYLCPSFKI